MSYSLRTISYFAVWGMIYGLLLGAFSGTAIFPYFGTMYAVIWGPGVGLACGLLSGVIAAIVHRTSFHRDTNLDQFRRRISLGIGVLTAFAAPLVLFATTQGVFWSESGLMSDMRAWTGLSLFSASFWGLLSSAYIGSHYPSFIARLTARREYQDADIDLPIEQREVSHAMRHLMRVGIRKWMYILAAVGSALVMMANTTSGYRYYTPGVIEVLGYGAAGAAVGPISLFCFGVYVTFGNAALLTFLKRVIFREYFPHLPPRWSRGILTLTALVFTAAVCFWSFILAPIIALYTASVVYRTLALPDMTFDKAKRKEKNALALEEDELMSDRPLLDELDAMQMQEQRS